MRKMFTVLFIYITLFTIVFLIKDSPSNTDSFYFVKKANISNGISFIELLIPQNAINDSYILVNNEMCEKNGIMPDSEIVTYDKDGYISYTYHNKQSYSTSKVTDCNVMLLGDNESFYQLIFPEYANQIGLFRDNHIMFAYVDMNGNVLNVTKPKKINPILKIDKVIIDKDSLSIHYKAINKCIIYILLASFMIIQVIIYLSKFLLQRAHKPCTNKQI